MFFGGKGLKGFAISERRKGERSLDQHRRHLHQFQIDRVADLIQMGANLLFVRNAEIAPLAVLSHRRQLLTVDQHGLIQSNPDLQVR